LYTQIVILWRRAIGLVVLTVAIGLPVSGTICAMLCRTGVAANIEPRASEVSESMPECHQRSSTERSAVRNCAGHECGSHDKAARLTTAIVVSRDNPSSSGLPAIEAARRLFGASAISDRPTVFSVLPIVKAPPGSAPVLRI
jgi:hypothetical protein